MALTKVKNRMIGFAPQNIVDYGADPTGVSDSTSAIQAALDYVSNNDGIVVFPDGDYLVSSTLTCNALNSRRIEIRGEGKAKIKWGGANNDIMFDLLRWTNVCEMHDLILENTNQATGCVGIRMTCWTGSGSTLSGVVDTAWLHDLVIGQPSDLGFERGLQLGDQTTYGSGEYFTYNNFDRLFFRHCNYGVYIDATTFDLCQFRDFNANGGGSASDGSDANSTNHFKSITNVDRLLIHGFNSNRCTDYAIDLVGGSVHLNGGWFETSGGGFTMSSSGSSRPTVIDYAKFTGAVLDGSGNSINFNGNGTITIRDCEFDTGDVYIYGSQPLVTSNNEYLNGATIARNDNRFKRVYNPRPLGQSAPHWESVKVLFSDFNTAASTVTFDIPVADEPTSTIIHDVVLRVNTGFTGGSVSAATLDFGDTVDPNGFVPAANIFTGGVFRVIAESDKGALLWSGTYPQKYVMTGAKTLRATINLTGGNGSDLTAGECYIYLLTSALYASESYYPEVFN